MGGLSSLKEHINELQAVLGDAWKPNTAWTPETGTFKQVISFNVEVTDIRLMLKTHLERNVTILRDAINEASRRVNLRLHSDAVLTYFNFAPQFKTACEQYLMYFVQFLKDLTGEEATAELREEAGEVLFSVMPQSGKEALGVVREALEIYINLPLAPRIDEIGSLSRDRAALELQGEVLQLKSKLLFATAALQERADEVHHLRSMNEQLIALAAATRNPNDNSNKDEEALIGDVITVGTVEKFGIKANLAALVRKLKRKRPNTPTAPNKSESPSLLPLGPREKE
jgi:hypothetical protein